MSKLGYVLFGVLLTVACGPTSGRTKTTVSNAQHVLVAFKGTVEIRKPDWARYSPVSFGELIGADDILRVSEDAKAEVVCSDLSKRTLQSLPPAPVPCTDVGELTVAPLGHLVFRDVSSATCPEQISPRRGLLLDPRPEIRWRAASGSPNYRISVRAGSVSWEREVRVDDGSPEGRLLYPPDEPALPPGVNVATVILGHQASSHDCEPQAPQLQLVTESERGSILAASKRLKSLDLGDAQMEYMYANLLFSRGLPTEAIKVLEPLSHLPKPEAAICRLLGDSYAAEELPKEAKSAYLEALNAAGNSSNVGIKAELCAKAASLTSEPDKRRELMSRAISFYKLLGDNKRANELAQEQKM